MKKWLYALLTGLAASVCLSGCNGQGTGRGDEPVIIRVAFNQSELHPEYIAMTEFGEKFKEATNGAYEVQIYPNAILGDQGPVTEFVRTGALQMAMVPVSVPEGYNPDFSIVSAPYLYDDMEQLRTAVREGVFDELFQTTSKYDFDTMTVYTSGPRHIYTDKPIRTPDDLKGYKIRVMDSDTYIKMINLMGGVGMPMGQGEVYTAIQQKVIEGGENSERVYMDFKHYEVAPYFSYTGHLVMADVVIANHDFVESMDQETRALFERLLSESMEREFDLMEQSIEEAKREAESFGTEFVYPDIELFREQCQPLLQNLAERSDTTRDIYRRVVEIREREGESLWKN